MIRPTLQTEVEEEVETDSDESGFNTTIMGPVILHPSVDAAVDPYEAPEIIERTEVIAFPFLSW